MIQNILLSVLGCLLVLLLFLIRVERKRVKKMLKDNEALMEEARKSGEDAIKEARAKTEFVANMSHEIRTPMNAISCATELLLKEELPPAPKSYLSILKSSSDSLLEMVNDILDFSKMDAGKMSLIEARYKLKSVLDDVKNIISVRLGGKPVAFTLEIEPTLPQTLIGDEVRIKQILINLLGNAVKYTTTGEISLVVTYERLAKDSIDITFVVKDTGCGIPPSEKVKLFKRFEQADVKNHRYTEGSGLGLAICSQLASMMGGNVSFESELGKGSSFKATIRQKVSENESEPIFNEEKGFSFDFLIWEDNVYYKENLEKILNSLGVATKCVNHVSELSSILSSVKIDYVVTTEKHFFDTVSAINSVSPTTIPVKLVEIGEPADTSFDGNFATLQRPVDVFEMLEILRTQEFREKHNADRVGRLMTPDARILVVDDNRVNLKVARALFETFNARVVAVDSGFEAVELIRMGEKFDLIFMDHMMPGMDGIEAAHKIWEIEGEKKTPVIALTANAGGEVEKLFFDAGMSDFIPKPIVMKHLNFVLQKWLPRDKQIFEEKTDLFKKTKDGRLKEKEFQPDWGLSKVWNDKKIFFELLHMYLEKSEKLVEDIQKNTIMDNKLESSRELLKISTACGAAKLPGIINEMINVGAMGEETLFDARYERVVEEHRILVEEIKEYLEKEEPQDVLTFD